MRRDELNVPEPPPYDRPGDSWMCGTHEHTCANGPSRFGRCPLAEACQPKRTWYGHRRRIVIGTLAATLLLIAFICRPTVAPKVFKPGNLANPHSQILSGTLTSARCASCHESASLSPLAWFNGGAAGHADVSQTDRCLDCHHRTIDPGVAKLAHNLPRQVRAKIRGRIRLASSKSDAAWQNSLPRAVVNQEDVDCAACHREHRGVDADLMAVSDAQCQSCHESRFGSFADSHPEWDKWPYGRGGKIAFNHQTHMTKHFPASSSGGYVTEFACNRCHTLNEENELTRSVSYEKGCRSCHEDALKMEAAKGLDLLALPSVCDEAADLAGEWPEEACGFTDGQVPPLAELLMRSDAEVSNALRRVPSRDLARLPPNDSTTNETLSLVATAHRRLLMNLANEGHPEILRRAKQAGVSPPAMQKLIRTLPPQLLIQTYELWFPRDARENLDQARKQRLGLIRLVDFTKALSSERRGPSILLPPVEPEDDILFGIPLIAQRPSGSRGVMRTPGIDFADDATLLGTDSTKLPKLKRPPQLGGRNPDQNGLPQIPKANMPGDPPSMNGGGSLGSGPVADDSKEAAPSLLMPNQGDAMAGDPLGDDPLLEDPLGDDPLGDDPLAMDPLDDDPLSMDPLTQDPLAEDPLSMDSLADDPLAEDPLAEDPLSEDPLAEDPLAMDPLAEDPLAMDPLGDDPLNSDPLSEDPLNSDPLNSDPLLNDPLAGDPLAAPAQLPAPKKVKRAPFDPKDMMPAGGWYRDDVTMKIGYRGSGHSDPVLRAAIEVIQELPPSDPVRKRLLATQAVAACVSCHGGAKQLKPAWHGQALVGRKSEFTKFRHGPHMNVSQLADCRHCHLVNPALPTKDSAFSLASFNQSTASTVDAPGGAKQHEFLPIKRQACAACHTAKAAGESCVTCHRYHIHQ